MAPFRFNREGANFFYEKICIEKYQNVQHDHGHLSNCRSHSHATRYCF